MKGPAESGQICSVGRRKIAKKIAKNKALLCQHLATPLKDAVEGDEGGLRGSLSPGSILPLRGTGDAASGLLAEKRHHRRCREPGNFAARFLVGRRVCESRVDSLSVLGRLLSGQLRKHPSRPGLRRTDRNRDRMRFRTPMLRHLTQSCAWHRRR